MKRFLLLAMLAACLVSPSIAFAVSNGQAETQQAVVSSVTSTSSQALTSIVGSRIAAISAPVPGDVAFNSTPENGNDFSFSMNSQDLGLSSGEDPLGIGVWGMGSYTHFSSSATNAMYEAESRNLMFGLDWRATDDLLVGLATGFGGLNLDKNNWLGDTGYLETEDEWTLMPYLAYNITDMTILDLAYAYTESRYTDNDGIATAQYNSRRYLSSVGLSQYYLYDNWTFSGRAGYMYVHGDLSSYARGITQIANPDSYLSQFSLEAKASYYYANGLQPYAALRYFLDASTSATPVKSDYDEFGGVLGVNWFAGDQWTINLEAGNTMGRQKFEAYRGQFNIRYDF